MTNARTLAYHSRILGSSKVFCDWQYDGRMAFVGGPDVDWAARELTDFNIWSPCLRQDTNVEESSVTLLKRIQINLRFGMLQGTDNATINVFIVTPRKGAVNRDFTATAPQNPNEFIQNNTLQGANVRLNPAMVKVHFCKYVTLTQNTLGASAVAGQTVGDPDTTWRKAQCTLRINSKVHNYQASGPNSWKTVGFAALPYWQKYWMIACAKTLPAGAGSGSYIFFDSLATTVNIG